METLKEIAIDAFIVIAAWFLMTAGQLQVGVKGLSCGQSNSSETTQAQ